MTHTLTNVKGAAKTRNQKTTRDRRALPRIPVQRVLDIGKHASMELTAARFGFPYVNPDNRPTEKVDLDLYVCRSAGNRP